MQVNLKPNTSEREEFQMEKKSIIFVFFSVGAIIVWIINIISDKLLKEKNLEVKILLAMIAETRQEIFQAKLNGHDVTTIEYELMSLNGKTLALQERASSINIISFKKKTDAYYGELTGIECNLSNIRRDKDEGCKIF